MPPDLDFAAPLRDALLAADFTYDRVAEAIGDDAHRALGRNETLPALRRTTSGGPLDTLVRLFLLQTPSRATTPTGPCPGWSTGSATPACSSRASARSRRGPTAGPTPTEAGDRDLWVVSDLTPGLDGAPVAVGPDHVLGISSASTSLAQLTMREPVGSAARPRHRLRRAGPPPRRPRRPRRRHRRQQPRALDDPAQRRAQRRRGRRAGRVVLRAGRGGALRPDRHQPALRDLARPPASGWSTATPACPATASSSTSCAPAPDHLTDGGWLQVLANWAIVEGRPWDERLGSWLRDDCDALVVQRETLDPAAYVELWLKDTGHHGGPGLRRALRHVAVVVRGVRASRASASAGSTCASAAGPAATSSSSGRTTSSSPSAPRSAPGARRSPTCAA